MSLKLWLPLNGNLDNQGLSSATITNNGATVNTSGKIGSCYSFDGNDDFISIDCQDLYRIFSGGTQQFTVAFWVYHADDTRAIILGDFRLSGSVDINIELSTDHKVRFYWDGTPDKTFNTAFAVSEWTHCAIVYSGTEVQFYKNGILQSDKYTGTLSTKSKTSGLYYLGRDSRTGTTALNGRLNDFRIYDHALSAKEIAELAKGLVLHYTLSGFGCKNYLLNSSTESNEKNSYVQYALDSNKSDLFGQTVTISADIKSTANNVACDTYFRKSSGMVGTSKIISGITTEYKRYSVTFTATTTTTPTHIAFRSNGNVSGASTTATYYFKNIKIELGDKETPWIPNPADALYSAMGFGDNVEYDVSGYGNDGTITGSIQHIPDTSRYYTCSEFTGTQRIVTNPLPLETTSISIWFKPTRTSNQCIFGDSASGLCAFIYSGGLITYFRGNNGGTGSRVLFGDEFNGDDWNHIVVIKTGEKTRDVYCNGVKLTPTSNNYYTNATGFFIGARNNSQALPFYGNLSDVRAYVTPLTQDQILELYQTGQSLSNNGTLFGYELIEDGGG